MSSNQKKKPIYREGTVNGVKLTEVKTMTRKQRQQEEYNGLVKILSGCICILVMVFVLNAVVTNSFKFNGIAFNEPEDNEVIEVIGSNKEDVPSERVNLHLKGKLMIKVEVGSKYVEPGFKATSDLNGDISEKVVVTGKVDTNTIGTYEITYTLSYRGISPKLTRIVKVVEKKDGNIDKNKDQNKDNNKKTVPSSDKDPNTPTTGENNPSESIKPNQPTPPSQPAQPKPSQPVTPAKPQGNITLKLNGDATIYLTEGSSYTDAFATATDNNGKDVSSYISVNGSVNTNVVGTYKITYSIKNYNGEVLTVIRNVIVQAMKISLRLDNNNLTNKAVNIIVSSKVDNFDRLELPNGTKVSNEEYSYKVTTNGTYEFKVYNTAGSFRKGTIIVNNIDKTKPMGKCAISYGKNVTYITITASDNSGISKYLYSGEEYTSNVITIGHKLATGIQINVGFYDKAGNFGNTNCLAP